MFQSLLSFSLFDIINVPFGYVIRFAYSLTGSYVLALLVFAIAVKLLLFPFGIKQQNNSVKQAALRPKESAIRSKYAGRTDKVTQQKMQQEIMELYQKENYSPFSGCLPLLIQFPVLISLYNVIRCPLEYIARLSDSAIEAVKAAFNAGANTGYDEIVAAREFIANPNGLKIATDAINNSDAIAAADKAAEIAKLKDIPNLSFNFFGHDVSLGIVSSTDTWGKATAFIITVLALTLITAFLGQWLTRKFSYQPATGNSESSMRIMNFVMPLFSVFIAYRVPIGLAIYWIFQNCLNPLQQFILSRIKPIPKLTDEELKKLEREYAKKEKIKPLKVSEISKARSLVYDEDDEEPEVSGKPLKIESIDRSASEQTPKKKKNKSSSPIAQAELKSTLNGEETKDEDK